MDACRKLKSMGADGGGYCGLFRPGREDWDLRCKIGVEAELTVSDRPSEAPRFVKYKPYWGPRRRR